MAEDVSGEQLRALRVAAGLDVAVLARRVSLSSAQLLQLENDQHSLFYTPAIRRHAARKVLNLLGSQLQAEQQSETAGAGASALTPIPTVLAPGLEAAGTAAAQITLVGLPIQDLTEQLLPAAPVISPGQAPTLAGSSPQTQAARRAGARSGRSSSIWWMGLFLAVTLLSVWLVLTRPFAGLAPSLLEGRGHEHNAGLIGPSSDASEQERPHSAIADSARAGNARTDNEAELVAMSPASSLPAQSSPSPPTWPEERTPCTAFVESSPAVALKSAPRQGSLVYLISSVSQVVCVRDGEGKIKAHRLEPGQATGVEGPLPWTLQASSLQKIQVYFQGGSIKLPADAKDRVQLLEPR